MTIPAAPFSTLSIDAVVLAYRYCALWSSTDELSRPLDDIAEISDIEGASTKQMHDDCVQFLEANNADVREFVAAGREFTQVGHDYWLTRNRHGAGFWDRGAGAVGERLTTAAIADGSRDLYLGDDGKVYMQ